MGGPRGEVDGELSPPREGEPDPTRFATLVRDFGDEVVRFIERKTHDYHVAQDLAQETFLQAYCSLDQLRSRDNLRQWVFKIAFHLTMDWMRIRTRGGPTVCSLESVVETSGDETVDRLRSAAAHELEMDPEIGLDVAVQRIVREVRGLPEDYGIVLVLRYLEELSCREIAALLRISLSSVKVKLFRGRQLLRRRMRAAEEEYQSLLT